MIITLDTETTGLDTKTARVLELALVTHEATPSPVHDKAIRDGHTYHWYFDPEAAIPPSSTAIHGITDAMVANKPTFRALLAEVAFVLRRATVIIGYNLDFDLRALRAEFERAKNDWPVSPTTLIVDVYRLWGKLEPRKLTNAHAAFVGGELDGAHSAANDARATRAVLDGMLRSFQPFATTPPTWEELAVLINPDGMLRFGPSNHLRWNGLPGSAPDADLLLFTFGKHNGKPITILASIERSYLQWIVDGAARQDGATKSFPEHVIEACQKALQLTPHGFTEWAKRAGGR